MACCMTMALAIGLVRAAFEWVLGSDPELTAFPPVAHRPAPGETLSAPAPQPPGTETKSRWVARAGVVLDAAFAGAVVYVAALGILRLLGVDAFRAFGFVTCPCCAPGSAPHAVGMGGAGLAAIGARLAMHHRAGPEGGAT